MIEIERERDREKKRETDRQTERENEQGIEKKRQFLLIKKTQWCVQTTPPQYLLLFKVIKSCKVVFFNSVWVYMQCKFVFIFPPPARYGSYLKYISTQCQKMGGGGRAICIFSKCVLQKLRSESLFFGFSCNSCIMTSFENFSMILGGTLTVALLGSPARLCPWWQLPLMAHLYL